MEKFIEKCNNFIIQDEKGKAYMLLVQKAVYQSLPYRDKDKHHPQYNTYAETEEFREFIEKLNNPKRQEEQKSLEASPDKSETLQEKTDE